LLLSGAACWAQSLQTIQLQHRTAEEIIPVLQPLLEPGGALSGQGYTLFVRTSAANLSQLRAAIEQIDRKQRQLLVSVRKSSAADIERERIEASGTVRTDRGAVSVNEDPSARSSVTVRGNDSRLRTSGGGISSVSVLEGSSAFIASGTSVPVITTIAGGVGRHRWGATSTQYRDLTAGFLVTPRVNGETVVLDIEQREEGVRDGSIRTQQLSTQVSARVGEWIQLGGIESSSTSTQSGILSRRHSTSSDSQSVWVKVDLQ
jgi:type II secretory pathway component GspD/PulD (secretin)